MTNYEDSQEHLTHISKTAIYGAHLMLLISIYDVGSMLINLNFDLEAVFLLEEGLGLR